MPERPLTRLTPSLPGFQRLNADELVDHRYWRLGLAEEQSERASPPASSFPFTPVSTRSATVPATASRTSGPPGSRAAPTPSSSRRRPASFTRPGAPPPPPSRSAHHDVCAPSQASSPVIARSRQTRSRRSTAAYPRRSSPGPCSTWPPAPTRTGSSARWRSVTVGASATTSVPLGSSIATEATGAPGAYGAPSKPGTRAAHGRARSARSTCSGSSIGRASSVASRTHESGSAADGSRSITTGKSSG